MRPPRKLSLDFGLPFGVTNHEQILITRRSTRIRIASYSPDTLSSRQGWRGQLIEKFLGRRFVTGPADSLRRLKCGAEQHPILS
jgi:hypothetical protein